MLQKNCILPGIKTNLHTQADFQDDAFPQNCISLLFILWKTTAPLFCTPWLFLSLNQSERCAPRGANNNLPGLHGNLLSKQRRGPAMTAYPLLPLPCPWKCEKTLLKCLALIFRGDLFKKGTHRMYLLGYEHFLLSDMSCILPQRNSRCFK